MEIERYLETIVDPTIDDLESHPTSVRYAFLACVAVFHSLDYLAHSESSEKQNRRSLFRKQSADFATVDRVAHAFKHVEAGHPAATDNQPLKTEGVIKRPPAYWDNALWDLSHWDDATGGVTLADDRQLDLLSTLKRAVAFIRTQIDPPAADKIA
jgi:hypothetical protein